MITVCSQCKRVISQTMKTSGLSPDDGEEKVSHGICSKCLIVLESKIREKPDYSVAIPPERGETLKTKIQDG